jgi:hypothetical protein
MDTEIALSICSSALILIGADTIETFEDGTNEALVAAQLYDNTLKSCLTEHRWNFAVDQKQASKLSTAPDNKWGVQYQLPSGLLMLDNTDPDWLKYELYNSERLYTDFDGELWIEGLFRVDESLFPYPFREYLEYRLAAKFAIPVADDEVLADRMLAQAEAYQRKAKLADSKQRKGVGFKRFPFTQVR